MKISNGVKKSLILIAIIVILGAVGVLIYQNMPEKVLQGKKVVMIIAFRDFRDAEYFVPKEILEEAGAKVKTASTKKGVAIGADGGDTEVDLLVSEINLAEFNDLQNKSFHDSIQSISSFNAVVFIGGPGCLESLDNEDSYKAAKDTVSQNKVLAAICISPVILAKAGALEGKKATVWSSPLDREPIETLEENGATYEDKPVVVDGKIITGNGPDVAEEFGKKILDVLGTDILHS